MDGRWVAAKGRVGWIVVGVLGVLVLVAIGVPLASLLYVGVLLLCPLMMATMHGGHGHTEVHRDHGDHGDIQASEPPEPGTSSSRSPVEGDRT